MDAEDAQMRDPDWNELEPSKNRRYQKGKSLKLWILSSLMLALFVLMAFVALYEGKSSIAKNEQAALQSLNVNGTPSGFSIFNGEEVTEGYEHVVQIRRNGLIICGGALIEDDIVLSASHCITEDKSEYQILAGSYEKGSGTIHQIKDLMRMETTVPLADLIKIQLTEKIDYLFPNFPIKKISIWKHPPTDEYSYTMAGFGSKSAGVPTTRMLKAEYQILLAKACNRKYDLILREFFLCAVNPQHESMDGDSGSPLSFKTSDGEEFLVAIHSAKLTMVEGHPAKQTAMYQEDVQRFLRKPFPNHQQKNIE